uniref:Uncharacterized protein n=1 Tax=Ditylenchus dipsaci TaxID=166011 RepID=A0A915CQZ3_9BILA
MVRVNTERLYCPGCKCDLATEIEDESQRILHYQEVQIGYAVMSEKKIPGTVCSNGLMLNTNVYGLRTSKVLVYCYNVKVVGVTQTGTLFDFTEVGRTDAEKIERRGKCSDVITELNNLSLGLIDGYATYYDLQQIMYSIRKLDFVTGQITYNVVMSKIF